MDFLRRHIFDLALAPFLIWLQWVLARRLRGILPSRWHRHIKWAGSGSAVLIGFTFFSGFPFVSQYLPFSPMLYWVKAVGLAVAISTAGAFGVDQIWSLAVKLLGRNSAKLPDADTRPDLLRRQFLLAGRAAAVSVPALALGYGAFVERHHFRLVESRMVIPGLPKDLDGLRLAQLTDLHFGPFFGSRDLRYAIDMANSTKPHLALVTGDFISVYSDPLDECMDLLRGLRAEAGVLGCLGNHEIVAKCEDYAELRGKEIGLGMLRNTGRTLQFGAAQLNIAGVDYQPLGKPYLTKVGSLVKKDNVNILLSHNPDVFPVAAAQGWDLTIAGHTHGGQISVEILGTHANIARFYTPYVYGNYKKDGRQIYVSRGLGTVGIPSRFGAPPEVSLLTLCAT